MTTFIHLNPAAQSAQRSYQDELDRGRFLIQCCSACGQNNFPPRELCPECGSPDVNWLQPSGDGAVYAVTTVRRKQEAGGDYNVSLIDLDEGVRMMSRVDGLASSDVQIGMRVRARILQQAGRGLVVFDVLEASAP